MKRVAALGLFLLLFCIPFIASAEIPKQIAHDFSPVSGRIIMPISDEYLVDLDASADLRVGDILTLVMDGEKIIQPATKVITGIHEQAKGYLLVTKIKSGYSYSKLLTPGISPTKGDKVKRFFKTPAQFKTTTNLKSIQSEVEQALPQLHWLRSSNTLKPKLIFIFDGQTLKVTNSEGLEIRNYPYNKGAFSAPAVGFHQPDNFQLGATPLTKSSFVNKALNDVTSVFGWGSKDERLENPAITQQLQLNDGIWIGPNLNGNPVGLAVADFDGDGKNETAVAVGSQLQIYRTIEGKQDLITNVDFAKGLELLSLDIADTDNNGTPELYLSAHVETKLSSLVVEFVDGHYKEIQGQIPWLFRKINFLQGGQLLLAQTINEREDNPLSTPVFQVMRSGNRLSKGESISVPTRMNVFNFTPFKGAKNDLLYAYMASDDSLQVLTPRGATIWQSGKKYNGSDVLFELPTSPEGDSKPPIYIQQRILPLETGEIIVAQNDGSRLFERYHNFTKSRLIAFKWNGVALQQEWSTADQSGYLADFTVADADNDGQDELVMVINYKQKNLLQKGRSAVVIYELNTK